MQRRILVLPFLMLFALCASGFQQIPQEVGRVPYTDKQATMLGLVRTINTFEVSNYPNGPYESWPALLQRNSSEFDEWLARNWPTPTTAKENQQHFSSLPEILPGIKLRLSVNADGRGYTVLLEDAKDKNGFAFVSDERGIIRESKYIY